MKPKRRLRNVGIVWYTEEELGKMKNISVDSELLENSFQEWKEMAEKTFADMKSTGIIGEKVSIKTEEFSIWCKIHSVLVDSSSRSKYVSEIM